MDVVVLPLSRTDHRPILDLPPTPNDFAATDPPPAGADQPVSSLPPETERPAADDEPPTILPTSDRRPEDTAATPKIIHAHRRHAPKKAPCPHCGQPGRRKQVLPTRTVRCLQYQAILLIHVTTAEYRASCSCCQTFRTQVEGIEPKAHYTNRVRNAVLDRLLDDHMNIAQTRHALQRDFCLDLSEGFVYDCLDWKIGQVNGADYRRWTLEHFSGTLCIDELHLGRYTLLLATDPLGDFPVAFALVAQNDQDHMERFLRNLQAHGFQPRVVVTDGSNLYPKLLAQIWPAAEHQLCVFHVLKDINEHVLDELRRLQRKLKRRGNRGRRRKKGRPKGRSTHRQRQTLKLKDQAHFIYKHRHLIVRKRASLTLVEQVALGRMQEYLPALRTLRQFVDEVYGLFASEQTALARRRHQALLQQTEYASYPHLSKALAMLAADKFEKMIAYLRSPAGQQVRTNNHVERTNRHWRLFEKVRYKWRQRRSIVRFVVLVMEHQWHSRRPQTQQPNTDCPNGSQTASRREGTKTPALASARETLDEKEAA